MLSSTCYSDSRKAFLSYPRHKILARFDYRFRAANLIANADQIGCSGVFELKLLHVSLKDLLELRTSEISHHATNNTPFCIGNGIKNAHKLVGTGNFQLDRVCFARSIVTIHCYLINIFQVFVPTTELRPKLVQDVVLSKTRKAFIEPDIVPPLHSHEIPKPHMRNFMGYCSGVPLV